MKTQPGIVAIVGRANVGKSSLFNALIGRKSAITAKEAGTTRDSLTARASWRDRDFWLVDTAGLKSPDDEFEASIQDQIAQAADSADVIIVVTEASHQITEEDRRVATLALKTKQSVVLAVNKADPGRQINAADWQKLGIKSIVAVSAIHKLGLSDLMEVVSAHLPKRKIKVDPQRLKIAILGRPNVGKSSLFNTLGKKQQALVADQAGTTRDVNRLSLKFKGKELEIMDTAGIRRSGRINRGVEQFSVLRALAAIEEADVCLLVLDCQEAAVKLDQKIAGLIEEAGKGLIIVVTKWDLAGEAGLDRLGLSQQLAREYDFVAWAPLVFTSSVTGENATKLFELALEVAQNRATKLATSELNRWLTSSVAHHPPAGLKNRHPKLNYIVQEDDQPFPNFKVFGNHAQSVHWSYRRYLERSMREKWSLAGTPIQFWFINKDKD